MKLKIDVTIKLDEAQLKKLTEALLEKKTDGDAL